MNQCKCGCGQAIPDSRVFVDKVHQTAWMRDQAAAEGYGRGTEGHEEARVQSTEVGESFSYASGCYSLGYALTGFLTFVASWIYCMTTYGFLLGFGLGWLPSAILATIVGAVWPLLALGIAAIAVMSMSGNL